MNTHAEAATSLDLLSFPAGSRIHPADAMNLAKNRILFLVTGSQGEPMSALARIAVDRHRDVQVEQDDLVIHSARVIPGNEKAIGNLFNHLLRRGARLVTASDADVHVSGHPSQEELKLVIQLLRPEFFIPIHGEYSQLLAHAALARDMGIPKERIVLADSGDLIALEYSSCGVVDRVPSGQVFIDAALEQVDWSVIKDRRKIAYDGIVVAVISFDRDTGKPRSQPEFVTRGFNIEQDSNSLLGRAGDVVVGTLVDATPEVRTDEGLLKARLQADLKRFFRRETQRRPMIIPLIVEF